MLEAVDHLHGFPSLFLQLACGLCDFENVTMWILGKVCMICAHMFGLHMYHFFSVLFVSRLLVFLLGVVPPAEEAVSVCFFCDILTFSVVS